MFRFYSSAAALAVVGLAIVAIPSNTQAQPYYGGMMAPYGGYGMMGDYGGYDGYAMGPGMMYGYGHGPGMMYGYGPYGRHHYYYHGPHYRGQHRCWHRTGPGRGGGFYGSCRR